MEGEILPAGWKWTNFGTAADFVNGDRGGNYPTQSDRVGAGVPFINTGHIEPNGRLSSAGMDYITRDSFERLRSGKVNPGDIVYCLRGSTIGKTARNHLAEGAIASSLVIVRAKAHACQEYLYFYLTSPMGKQLVAQHDNGSAQPNLSVRSLCNYPLPLPPICEQRAIARILGTLDDKIELNRHMNETLEAMARALFKSWFVDFDPVRAKAEGRDPGLPKSLADLFPDSFEDSALGEIPKGWSVGKLGDLLVQRVERCVASAETAARPYVPIDCISPRSLFLMESKPGQEAQSSLTKFYKGDLLFGAMRPYFHKVCIAPFDGTTRTTAFVLFPRAKEDFAFVTLLLHHPDTIDYATQHSTGSTIPYAVWSGSLEEMPVIVPPSEVRRTFDVVLRPILDRIPKLYFQNKTLATLRDTLLPKLISGELRVGDARQLSTVVL